MSYKTLFATLLLVVSMIVAGPISGTVGGAIEGVVTDPKGAVVKDAVVTAKDIVTGQIFTATTNGQGRYKIVNLPAGTYVLTINAKGFDSFTKDTVVVGEGKTLTVSAKLEIAPIETGRG